LLPRSSAVALLTSTDREGVVVCVPGGVLPAGERLGEGERRGGFDVKRERGGDRGERDRWEARGGGVAERGGEGGGGGEKWITPSLSTRLDIRPIQHHRLVAKPTVKVSPPVKSSITISFK